MLSTRRARDRKQSSSIAWATWNANGFRFPETEGGGVGSHLPEVGCLCVRMSGRVMVLVVTVGTGQQLAAKCTNPEMKGRQDGLMLPRTATLLDVQVMPESDPNQATLLQSRKLHCRRTPASRDNELNYIPNKGGRRLAAGISRPDWSSGRWSKSRLAVWEVSLTQVGDIRHADHLRSPPIPPDPP
ncbi:hypothetical protein E4U40_007384 [Claviceps sp. LM458 group G5]|nr:hypothetical protein E4U40_007384 [Claviceps sp. LM458 group G5]